MASSLFSELRASVSEVPAGALRTDSGSSLLRHRQPSNLDRALEQIGSPHAPALTRSDSRTRNSSVAYQTALSSDRVLGLTEGGEFHRIEVTNYGQRNRHASLALAEDAHGVSNARKLFASMDTDGSGQVSTDELLSKLVSNRAVSEAGAGRARSGMQRTGSMAQLMASIDSSGDGEISFGEFSSWISQHEAQQQASPHAQMLMQTLGQMQTTTPLFDGSSTDSDDEDSMPGAFEGSFARNKSDRFLGTSYLPAALGGLAAAPAPASAPVIEQIKQAKRTRKLKKKDSAAKIASQFFSAPASSSGNGLRMFRGAGTAVRIVNRCGPRLQFGTPAAVVTR